MLNTPIGAHPYRWIVVAAVLACGLNACAYLPSRPKRQTAIPDLYHIAQPGQTLSQLAHLYEVPLTQLQEANRLAKGAALRVGQRLLIPGMGRRSTLPMPPEVSSASPATSGSRRTPSDERLARAVLPAHRSFIWPLRGRIVSRFGEHAGGRNDGIDVAAPPASEIVAASAGRVIFSDWGPEGFGRLIIIKHQKNFVTVYAHNEVNYVQKNDLVRQGQTIARIGSTGDISQPRLHFEVRRNRRPQNPLRYLPK